MKLFVFTIATALLTVSTVLAAPHRMEGNLRPQLFEDGGRRLAKPPSTPSTSVGANKPSSSPVSGPTKKPASSPGSTTNNKNFTVVAALREHDFCFNGKRFCDGYWAQVDYRSSINGRQGYCRRCDNDDEYSRAIAFAGQRTMCRLTEVVGSYMGAFVVATGDFNVDQAGNNGAVKKVNLTANVGSSTFVTAFSNAEVGVWSDSGATSYATTSMPEFCRFLYSRYTGYWYTRYLYEYFQCERSYTSATSYVSASAQATGSASGSSSTGSNIGYTSSVAVEGANIKNFTASMSLAASTFASASTSAYASAYTSVWSTAMASNWKTTCRKTYKYYLNWWYGWRLYSIDEFCNDSFHYAQAYASAYASAYARAYATSLARTSFTVLVSANFTRVPGKGDEMHFTGKLEADGVARAYGSFYCRDDEEPEPEEPKPEEPKPEEPDPEVPETEAPTGAGPTRAPTLQNATAAPTMRNASPSPSMTPAPTEYGSDEEFGTESPSSYNDDV